MNRLIALDCDGVLLDYNSAYPRVWRRLHGAELPEPRPECYHAANRFALPFRTDAERQAFVACFDEDDWSTMPALPGAVAACRRLERAGHELVCVTAMPARFREARRRNLERLGFPISDVIATGRHAPGTPAGAVSPKADVIHRLAPLAFVDDWSTNFVGIDPGVHRVLIDRGCQDGPNGTDADRLCDAIVPDLVGFARHWLDVMLVQAA